MVISRAATIAAVTVLIVALSECNSREYGSQTRLRADKLSKEKKYEEAVKAYWDHINFRLSVKDRPVWENPYIYLLDIGDLYLEKGDVEQALYHYELAEKKRVKQAYVNDRYRYVASWYEE